jgi:hypothetical protein
MLGIGGGHSLGLVMQGWLGDRVGLRLVTAVTALALLLIVATVHAMRSDVLRAMDEPTATPAPV